MSFKSDHGGFAFSCGDLKLQTNVSTWATRLSQLARQHGVVRILTYSLPRLDYVERQLQRRPHDIFLIAHARFRLQARAIKARFPEIRVALHLRMHSKILLIEPQTLILTSANFGQSGWHESTLSMRSGQAHDWYLNHMFEPAWAGAEEIL